MGNGANQTIDPVAYAQMQTELSAEEASRGAVSVASATAPSVSVSNAAVASLNAMHAGSTAGLPTDYQLQLPDINLKPGTAYGNAVYDDGTIQTYADPNANLHLGTPVPIAAEPTATFADAYSAAERQLLGAFNNLPGILKSSFQDGLVNFSAEMQPLIHSSNPLIQAAAWTGDKAGGLLYAGSELMPDSLTQAGAGVVSGEVLGAIAKIPAVSQVLNTDLIPLLGKAGQGARDLLGTAFSGPSAGSYAAQRGAVTLLGEATSSEASMAEAPNIVAESPAAQIRDVDPRQLVSRQGLDEMDLDNVRMLRQDMEQYGYDTSKPIDAADVDGQLIILDGHHRVQAAIGAQIPDIPVRINPVTSERAATLSQQATQVMFGNPWEW